MPTARSESGGVCIPGLGDLVVGGRGDSGDPLRTAELLGSDGAGVRTWKEVSPMIEARVAASAVYLDGTVFVGNSPMYSGIRISSVIL